MIVDKNDSLVDGLLDVEDKTLGGLKGIVETSREAVEVFSGPIQEILKSVPVESKKDIEDTMCKIIAGAAMLGYKIGFQDASSDEGES
jgi:hypothetical protein